MGFSFEDLDETCIAMKMDHNLDVGFERYCVFVLESMIKVKK
jgi:hypothetical protein